MAGEAQMQFGEYSTVERSRAGGVGLGHVALAELAGTALLLLLTCVPTCVSSARPDLLTRAFTAGLVVALLVQCLDHVSGAHLNPAVTLAAVLGAGAGAAVLALLAEDAAPCVTLPTVSAWRAASLEALCGMCLALANLAAWDARNGRGADSWPLRIGLVVTALNLVAGDASGASVNPLRSLAPALLARCWAHHWVYWVGPLSGSAAGAALYAFAWSGAAAAATL